MKNNSSSPIAYRHALTFQKSKNKVIFPMLPLTPGPRIKAEKQASPIFGKVPIHHTL